MEIDGKTFSGTTDDDGRVKQYISPSAKSGKLVVGEELEAEEYKLKLGYLDPVSEDSGVQSRLKNLGFICGKADGDMQEKTIAAIKKFQAKAGLSVTGEIDQSTKDALVQEHGS